MGIINQFLFQFRLIAIDLDVVIQSLEECIGGQESCELLFELDLGVEGDIMHHVQYMGSQMTIL